MEHSKIWETLLKSEGTDKLVAWLIEMYHEETQSIGYTAYEKEAKAAREYFEQLQDGTSAQITELEAGRNAQKRHAVTLGLQFGMFAGFKQYFVEEYTGYPYDDFYKRTLNPRFGGKLMQEFGQLRAASNTLSGDLIEGMDDCVQDHLTSIEVEHEEQENGIMRYAFLLGYHAAHEIICEVETPGEFMKINEKVWKTEHRMGFKTNFAERWL